MAISAEIIHLASMANVLSPTNQKSFAMANISIPKTIRVIAAQKAHAPMPIYRATTIAARDVTISAHFAPMGDASRLASAIKSSAMANASIPMSTMPIAVPKAFAIRSQKTTKIIRAWLAQVARYAPKAHATSRALLGKSSAMANASIPMSTMPIAVPKAFAIRSQKTTKIIRAWLAQAATSVPKANAALHASQVRSNAATNASIRSQIIHIAVPKAFAIRSQKTTKIIRAWLAQAATSVPKANAALHASQVRSNAATNASIHSQIIHIAVLRAIARATTPESRAPVAMSVLAALAISHALACKSYAIIYASTLRPTTSIAVLAEGVIAIRSTVPISAV